MIIIVMFKLCRINSIKKHHWTTSSLAKSIKRSYSCYTFKIKKPIFNSSLPASCCQVIRCSFGRNVLYSYYTSHPKKHHAFARMFFYSLKYSSAYTSSINRSTDPSKSETKAETRSISSCEYPETTSLRFSEKARCSF